MENEWDKRKLNQKEMRNETSELILESVMRIEKNQKTMMLQILNLESGIVKSASSADEDFPEGIYLFLWMKTDKNCYIIDLY